MATPLGITVYSDVICPWCYVGKRRLEAALAALSPAPELHLHWRPFELNPDMPSKGMERGAYRARKFGAARAAELDREMSEIGQQAGVAFAFERMTRTPNTRLAHRLIWEADRQGRQDALVERLFRAYFAEGADIGERTVLEALAADAGLATGGVASALAKKDSLVAVVELEREGQRLGIAGVPFFLIGGRYAVSGAQPAAFWRDALSRLAPSSARA